MLFWRLTIARKSSACITCNLLFDHRRQSVVRWANWMWVWREKSVTDWSVDSHANSILSLSLDIEKILIFLNALHSTSEQTTQRLVILTSSFVLSKTQDARRKTHDAKWASEEVRKGHWWGTKKKWTLSKGHLSSLQWTVCCPRRDVKWFEDETVGPKNKGQKNWPSWSDFEKKFFSSLSILLGPLVTFQGKIPKFSQDPTRNFQILREIKKFSQDPTRKKIELSNTFFLKTK